MASQDKKTKATREELRNEDPITGAAGSHPVGTGVGAAIGGAAAGAAAGAAGGPVGAVAGAIVGGVAGGYAGKAVAENVDPTVEAAYWESEYRNRPYVKEAYEYNHYQPAYRAGWEAYESEGTEDFATREAIARQRWENEGGAAHMSWEEARPAAEDAYTRVNTRVQPRANKPR
ncbi:hypothetical protein Poly24_16930 [Rosistilla carotiformis]|uniref:Glycine zipper domain-containing protein n=1 Tax=Rosistilla carotiformis TaxID=2528017 RepID=A0A518JR23_9BACT|nr:hypothetical protein [Rosistilla carotiformis]QDV67987.1 hypothetical protein Poly24_16930 [Rosistilla carotiformis]